jgi:hypothetical protein
MQQLPKRGSGPELRGTMSLIGEHFWLPPSALNQWYSYLLTRVSFLCAGNIACCEAGFMILFVILHVACKEGVRILVFPATYCVHVSLRGSISHVIASLERFRSTWKRSHVWSQHSTAVCPSYISISPFAATASATSIYIIDLTRRQNNYTRRGKQARN